MNTSSISQDNNFWDAFIDSYIVENNDNKRVWSGPHAQTLLLATPIHTITACNPLAQLLSINENKQRNKSLQKRIVNLNVEFKLVIGCSPDNHWKEPSFAVSGLNRAEACKLAWEFDQHAIFELTENELLVLDVSNYDVKRRRPRVLS